MIQKRQQKLENFQLRSHLLLRQQHYLKMVNQYTCQSVTTSKVTLQELQQRTFRQHTTNIANQLFVMINLSHLFKDGFSLSKIFTKAKNIIFVFRHFMATKALFNSVVNWFIGRRIDQIERFIAHPYETQKGVLFLSFFWQRILNTD